MTEAELRARLSRLGREARARTISPAAAAQACAAPSLSPDRAAPAADPRHVAAGPAEPAATGPEPHPIAAGRAGSATPGLAPDSPAPPGLPPVSPEAVARPVGSDDAAELLTRPLVSAAVLVGIVTGPAPGVLLTRRSATLRRHAGQVSFPGGRRDPGDADAEATALREAAEEVGLEPGAVELLGRLGDYVTGSGYLVTPVLALVAPGQDLRPAPEEVETIFQLPLAVLLDPAAPQRRRAELRGRSREFWVWPHPEHYIWGATAAILVQLAQALREAA